MIFKKKKGDKPYKFKSLNTYAWDRVMNKYRKIQTCI